MFYHKNIEITVGKGIVRIHKQSQTNWPYPSPNTTFVILKHPYTFIQTQRTSYCDASLGAHALASSVSDQITIHHVNTDTNNNDDSQSFGTLRKNNLISSCVGDTIATTAILS